MRQLSHTGTTVKEYRPICVSCALAHVAIEGAKCRECIEKADRFWTKRIMVRARSLVWIALGFIVVMSIADLIRRYK